ncbi:hypothetical protein C0992_006784 [Termitomyces sp. T32_za158]|nr:hypothetical protein C0992_006784 [Termitomyces sp. T32_za158]
MSDLWRRQLAGDSSAALRQSAQPKFSRCKGTSSRVSPEACGGASKNQRSALPLIFGNLVLLKGENGFARKSERSFDVELKGTSYILRRHFQKWLPNALPNVEDGNVD